MANLEELKLNLIEKIDDLFGFNIQNRTDGISYDFGQYRLNKLYKPLVKYFVDQFLKSLEEYSDQDAKKIIGLFSDFFSLYYSNGDFGYFKNKFSNFEYRIPYSGDDTEFWWATKDCYYVKTSDVVNNMNINIGGLLENKEMEIKMYKRIEEVTTDTGDIKYPFDIKIEDIIDEEGGIKGYSIIFINADENKVNPTSSSFINKISEVLKDKIDYKNTLSLKKSVEDFLKKWGRDYFIHKRLKTFLNEELEWYFFQMFKKDIKGKASILEFQTKIEEIKLKYADEPDVVDFKIGKMREELKNDINGDLYKEAYLWIENYINILADLEEFKAKLWNKKRKITQQYYCISMDNIDKSKFNEVYQAIQNNPKYISELRGVIADKYRDSLQGKYVTNINFDYKNEKIVLTLKKFKKDKGNKELPSGFYLNDYMLFENNKGELLFQNSRNEIYNTDNNEIILEQPLNDNIYVNTKYISLQTLGLAITYDDITGFLIKSENYQALKSLSSIVPEWNFDLIWIDPPFNTENDQFCYKDTFLDSSWMSLMQDRLNVALTKLSDVGSVYIHLDENGEYLTRFLSKSLTFKRTLFRNSGGVGFKAGDNWIRSGDIINYFGKENNTPIWNPSDDNKLNSNILDTLSVQDSRFNNKENLGAFWRVKGTTQKTEDYVSRYISKSSNVGSYVMDYFMGTGTTCAVAHKMGRKYVGIEMGTHYDLITSNRMKKVLIGDMGGISEDVEWKGGGIISYVYLNQYEDWFDNGGYIDSIEGEIGELSNMQINSDGDIKEILYPLNELKNKIYNLDDEILK